MKHIKLFEQMYEEDEWWDELDPYENKLMLAKRKGSKDYYLVKEIIGNEIVMYDSLIWRDLESYEFNPKITDDDTVIKCGENAMIFKYKDMPKEIKDRLV